MLSDAAGAARLRAYSLLEAVQGDAPERALAELVDLEAEARRSSWPEVELLAAAGQVVHALAGGADPSSVGPGLDELLERAESIQAGGVAGLVLALRALAAAGREDSAAVLADAGRAVVLAEDESLRALDRCTVLVVCAAAYNALSLWELVDELYDRASALAPECEQPLQEAAVAVNRVLIRIEWATALFELGDEKGARDQLHRASDAVGLASDVHLPPRLWRLEVRACGDVIAFALRAFGDPVLDDRLNSDERLGLLDEHRAELSAAGDVEVLPLLDGLVALGLLRLGRRDEAASRIRLRAPGSASSGARSFPLWVRAQVLTDDEPGATLAAHQEYGVLVSRSRWSARRAVLAAARSKIADKRRSAEHEVLARDVLLDPLTGLSNRRVFDVWLSTVPEHDQATALLLVDLDDFKIVNDLHGHAVGDETLRRVARLLAQHIRPGDLALRLGGDEFALVMAGVDDVGTLSVAAAARARALASAVALTDWDRIAPGMRVSVSVGVAVTVLGPGSPAGADRLYRDADAHLYEAKSAADSQTG
jgi:diguanylate cyclase (GGDEF)-like protein